MHLCLHIWLSRCVNALCKTCVDLWVVVMASAGLLKFLLMFIPQPVYLSYTPCELDSECDHVRVCVYKQYDSSCCLQFVFMPVLPALLKISLKPAHLLLHLLLDNPPPHPTPLWIAPPCHEMHATNSLQAKRGIFPNQPVLLSNAQMTWFFSFLSYFPHSKSFPLQHLLIYACMRFSVQP